MMHSFTNLDPITNSLLPIILLLFAFLGLLIIGLRGRASKRPPEIRPLPAFDRLPSELGRAAEAGASLHIGLGSGRIGGGQTLSSLAGIQVLEALSDAAVNFGTPPIVTVGDPTILPIAQDMLRRASIRQGVPGRYSPTSVRFISSSPVIYALGAGEVVGHELVMGNVLAGSFDEEVALITLPGERRGVLQSTAADKPHALGALYPADTLLATGEEMYAGAARLTGSLRHLVSISTQDMLRILIVLAILLKVFGIL